jgi:tetratricopeptide (TPR) repeat protein
LPDGHVAAAIIKSANADWKGAERDFRRAIDLAPGNVLARQEYAHWLSLHARFEEALEHARLAESLDRLSVRAILAVSSVLRFARRYDAALVHTHRALEMDPTSRAAYLNLGHCY